MKNLGFTLIELVVAILLISVLAVTVFPSLPTSSDYSSITERDQTISLLRTVQQRAMQNTQTSNTCHTVILTTNQIGLLNQNSDGSCGSGISTQTNTNDYLYVEVENNFTTTDNLTEVSFDKFGKPAVNMGLCSSSQCQISFSGDAVCIEAEGYIHVCP